MSAQQTELAEKVAVAAQGNWQKWALTKGIVFDIEPYAIHDGPGIRTTVYLKGCLLSCPWCHNPEGLAPEPEIVWWKARCIRCFDCIRVCPPQAITELPDALSLDLDKCDLCGKCVEVCPSGAWEIIGKAMSVADVMREVEKDRVFYEESGGGVTFSGGEPLMQADFLADLLECCKERDIHTALDTSGYAEWETVERLSHNVDLFLYDLKFIDEARHLHFTGVSNEPILRNLRELSSRRNTMVVRLPLVPGINDDEDNIKAIGQFVASLANVEQISLLPYHKAGVDKYQRLRREYELPDILPPTSGRIAEVVGMLRQFGLTIKVGG